MSHYHQLICLTCYSERIPPKRAALLAKDKQSLTCMTCGEKNARRVKHTIAPMNKSNYMVFTDRELLKQLNPKENRA